MRMGDIQDLIVFRESPHGLYLADDDGEVLLPNNQCPDDARQGDIISAFVYTDSEDRPIATMKRPYAVVGEFAMLEVVSAIYGGAFLDWGLDKDLFCPASEQIRPMKVGEVHLVKVILDKVSDRVIASGKVQRNLKAKGDNLMPGQKVRIIVAERTPDVIKVIINNEIRGTIFPDEWHDRLQVGDVKDAYVKTVRPEDGKVAVSLRPQGYVAVLGERETVLSALKANGGSLEMSDKSSPEEIYRRFGLSKGAFKKLIGTLYKEGKIVIESNSIRLKSK